VSLQTPPAPGGPSVVRTAALIVLLVVGAALGLVVLYRIRVVILALVFAIFFAYLIAPLVFTVERLVRRPSLTRSASRGLAVGLVYVVSLLVAGGTGLALAPRLSSQAAGIAEQAPEYVTAIRTWSTDWAAWERARLSPGFRAQADEAVAAAAASAVAYAQESALAALTILGYVPWLVLIPVLAFFFLKDLDDLRYHGVQALPPHWRGPGYRLVQELNTALASYVRAQLLACLIIGVTCGVGFALLRVPYAALLGVLAGVLEFVPLAGPLVVALIAGVVAGVQTPALGAGVLAFLLVLRVIEDYVIYPRLIGRGTHLHPLAIIVAVLAGAELGGVVGIFLSVPAVASLTVAYRHWTDWTHAAPPHAAQAQPAATATSRHTPSGGPG